MDVQLVNLPWLPEPPVDFREQLQLLPSSVTEIVRHGRRLALHRLSNSQLHRLGTALSKVIGTISDACRLGILSNGTTDLLTTALTASALRHGVMLQIVTTPFDQVATEALDPRSDINRARCHFVLLALDHHGLPFNSRVNDESHALATVQSALDYTNALRRALRDASGCTVIVQTVPQITDTLFGNLDRNVPGTTQWLIDRYNTALRAEVQQSSDLLFDVATLAETVGLDRWHDPAQWNLGKFSFAHAIVPLYADWVGRLVASARGKSRKCLVLDLDNTLWGGVIADDGIEGIVLGNGSAAGEAHLEIQRTALALRERGIILAISSKNDDGVARTCFRRHPEMLLKEDHIAVFQANWQDKAANLAAISRTLNIGIDSLVLLDDNPAERAQVRQALPEVAVPELPADPAYYSRLLLSAGYFESTAFTSDDRSRADQYRANAARTAALGAATDPESFLRTLDMRITFRPFDASSRPRITQLINKTNQFNLTTRRYSDAQVRAFEESGSGLTLQVRLADRFGDNGLISVVICIAQGQDWLIDTWLMSCRVLNRRVEQATLNHLVSLARAANVDALVGHYLRSERNAMVKDHYARLGFQPVSATDEMSAWRLIVATHIDAEVPMTVVPVAEIPDDCQAVG